MRWALLLFLAFLVLAGMSSSASAQPDLGLRFMRGGADAYLRYSGNGAYLFSQGGTVSVYRTADRTMLMSLYFSGIGAVCPVHDGSAFYYPRGRDIFFFDVPSRTGSLFRTEAAGYGGVDTITLSADGTKMAYQTLRQSDSRYIVTIVDIATKAVLRRIELPASVNARQIEFLSADTRLLVGGNGLRLYALNGTLVASRTSPDFYEFTRNPARTKVFAVSSDNTEVVGLDAAKLTELWKRAPNGLTSAMKCSSDGKVLIDQRSGISDYTLRSYSTVDGSILPGAMDPVSPGSFIAWQTAPDNNELVLLTYADVPRTERWSFNSDTGQGVQVSDMNEGAASAIAMLGSSGAPLFATSTGAGWWNARHVSDGSYTGFSWGSSPGPPPLPQMISPNGKFSVRIGYKTGTTGWGVHVHTFPGNALVASHALADAWDNPKTYGWAGDSFLYVHTGPTVKRLRTLSFSGTALTRIRDFNNIMADEFRLTADGKRLVAWNIDNTNARIFNAESGDPIGNIPMSSPNPASGVVYWTIVGKNLLAMHEWVIVGGNGYRNQVRFVDLMNPALPVVANTGYVDNHQQVYDNGITRITPDGSIVVFLLIPQNLNGDFSSQSKLTMMRVSDGAVIRSFTNLPASSWVAFTGGAISADGSTFLAANGSAFFGIQIPPTVSTLTVDPTAVIGGQSSTGTVTISQPAGVNGIEVALGADPGLGVPATVTIPAGQTIATFQIGTSGVDADTAKNVSATLDGLTLQAQLTVKAANQVHLMMNPVSVDAGQTSVGTVMLNGAAGPSGKVVSLSSDKAFASVPGSVLVPAGQMSATFNVTTSDPGATGTATVTASIPGHSSNAVLEVKSPWVITPTFNQAAVKGGNWLELTLTINPTASDDRTFTLTGDALLAPPATITIPAGKTSVSVGVRTLPTLADQTATLTVSNSLGFSKSVSATVQAPVLIGLFPTLTMTGGPSTVDVIVMLDGPAPAGLSLAASSNNTNAATIPATVTVPEGALFAVAKVTVKKQSVRRKPTITIGSLSFGLTILPTP